MATAFTWPKSAQCAVSLTYDDGLPIHYTHVGPTLEKYGLRATFYPMIQSNLLWSPDRWRDLAQAGHELGNHSVFHPCRRTTDGQYPWLEESYNLCAYSPARFRAELEVANFALGLLDGQTERTYGNTCCDTTLGMGDSEQLMDTILADMFVAARGALTNTVAEPFDGLNLMNVGCISADGRSLDELIAVVEQARVWRLGRVHDSWRWPCYA